MGKIADALNRYSKERKTVRVQKVTKADLEALMTYDRETGHLLRYDKGSGQAGKTPVLLSARGVGVAVRRAVEITQKMPRKRRVGIVVAGIDHRLGPVLFLNLGQLAGDNGERLVPRDSLKLATTLGPRALQRIPQSPIRMYDFGRMLAASAEHSQ